MASGRLDARTELRTVAIANIIDNWTISKSTSSYKTVTLSSSNIPEMAEGYSPIGVSYISLANANSSGLGVSHADIMYARIRPTDSAFTVRIFNNNTSTAIKIRLGYTKILIKKGGGIN